MNGKPRKGAYADLAMDMRPFCQLASRAISAMQCLELQGQPGCFGCGSPCRKCESCITETVSIPAVGLCSGCAIRELESEDRQSQPLADTSHPCQIVGRTIGLEMCLATQGQEGCRNCATSSRLCEKCKKRRCRFPQYGLCLRCSIEEFGEGWNPESARVNISTQALPSVEVANALLQMRGKVHPRILRKRLPHLTMGECNKLLEDCERCGWVSPKLSESRGAWRHILLREEQVPGAQVRRRHRPIKKVVKDPRVSIADKKAMLFEIAKVLGKGQQANIIKSIVADLDELFDLRQDKNIQKQKR